MVAERILEWTEQWSKQGLREGRQEGRTIMATRLSAAVIRSYSSQSALRRRVVALKI